MINEEYIDTINGKTVKIITKNQKILSVEKINNPTYENKIHFREYEDWGLGGKRITVREETPVTIVHDHYQTELLLEDNESISMDTNFNVEVGWTIKTVIIKIDNEEHFCTQKIMELNQTIKTPLEPEIIIRNNCGGNVYDGSSNYQYRQGIDKDGRRCTMMYTAISRYDTTINCTIGAIVFFLVVPPIIFLYLLMYYSGGCERDIIFQISLTKIYNFLEKIKLPLSNYKASLFRYYIFAFFMTFLLKNRIKKLKVLRKKDIEDTAEDNRRWTELMSGTKIRTDRINCSNPSNSFSSSYQYSMDRATKIYEEFMEL